MLADSLADVLSLPLRFSAKEWQILARLEPAKSPPNALNFGKLTQILSGHLSEALNVGVINQHRSRQLRGTIAVREGSLETIVPVGRLYDYDSAMGTIERLLEASIADEGAREIASRITRSVLRPNLIFDEAETNRASQMAEENVPRSTGFVQQNELVIAKNQSISEEAKLKLDSFQRSRRDRGTETQEWRHWIGIALIVVLILGLYVLYIYLFRKKIFSDNGKLLIISILLVFEAFLAFLSVRLPIAEPIEFLICVPVASMLLAIIFDSRVAFYGTVSIAFLIGAMRGNDFAIGLISLVAGAFSVYTVRDISHRTQIFRSIIFIFLGYTVSILALSIEQFESLSSMGIAMTFAIANAVLSPVLTYALLLFFEKAFNVTTDLTLVALSDLNHPLLQELSEKAPGTFHHSIMIGNLAEAGAEAIGANTILAKVGGYYHDIGKMLKPEYFVENQVGIRNRHNRLRPRMSALIIAAHVREGIELGRERKLPQQIIDFIPQHHGTNRISFFYDKAIRQSTKRPPKESINEEDFRYPGPKPQSKETGIVMLADSVEASTRALAEMTPHTLERSIDNMIKHRFMEGQLDECELTLRDLSNIREAFLQILIGIHHQRISYPEQLAAVQPPEPEFDTPAAGEPGPDEQIQAGAPVGDQPQAGERTQPAAGGGGQE